MMQGLLCRVNCLWDFEVKMVDSDLAPFLNVASPKWATLLSLKVRDTGVQDLVYFLATGISAHQQDQKLADL